MAVAKVTVCLGILGGVFQPAEEVTTAGDGPAGPRGAGFEGRAGGWGASEGPALVP